MELLTGLSETTKLVNVILQGLLFNVVTCCRANLISNGFHWIMKMRNGTMKNRPGYYVDLRRCLVRKHHIFLLFSHNVGSLLGEIDNLTAITTQKSAKTL